MYVYLNLMAKWWNNKANVLIIILIYSTWQMYMYIYTNYQYIHTEIHTCKEETKLKKKSTYEIWEYWNIIEKPMQVCKTFFAISSNNCDFVSLYPTLPAPSSQLPISHPFPINNPQSPHSPFLLLGLSARVPMIGKYNL